MRVSAPLLEQGATGRNRSCQAMTSPLGLPSLSASCSCAPPPGALNCRPGCVRSRGGSHLSPGPRPRLLLIGPPMAADLSLTIGKLAAPSRGVAVVFADTDLALGKVTADF